MGKRKSADDILVEEARKTSKEAPKRSSEYKEAMKLLEKAKAKAAEHETENDSEMESHSGSESSGDDDDEEEEEDEYSQKPRMKRSKVEPGPSKKVTSKKGKAGKNVIAKKSNKRVKTVKKNFVKDDEEKQNELFYEAAIGQGFTVQLSKWLKNGNTYLSIRKPGTSGITLSVDFFNNLKQALNDIEEQFPDHLKN